MRATDPKLVKGCRKLKKGKHCTTLNLEQNDRKRASKLKKLKLKQKVEKEKNTKRCKKMHQIKFGGAFEIVLNRK